VAQRTQALPERSVMQFEYQFQNDLCLPTALGCHLMEAETSVRRRFWGSSRTSNSLDQGNTLRRFRSST